MKEMVGGCCVCSDDRGWPENPLVYCDGQGCTVAVHQACYGIVTVPSGPWFCRKCESQERAARVRCELCPSKDGALKRTDTTGWAHVLCALYIPEVRFGNVTTMEPIILSMVPPDRYNKGCYICESQGRESKSKIGACMNCNKTNCKLHFHVTCAQAMGLLCEEAGTDQDNVKYCGYCQHHYSKLKKGSNLKAVPAFKPLPTVSASADSTPEKLNSTQLGSGSTWGGQHTGGTSNCNGSKEKARKKPGRKSTSQASPKAGNSRDHSSSSVIVEGYNTGSDSKMKSSIKAEVNSFCVLASVGLVPGPSKSAMNEHSNSDADRHEPIHNVKQENFRTTETIKSSGIKKNDKSNDSLKPFSSSAPAPSSVEVPSMPSVPDKSRTSRRKGSTRSVTPTSQGGNDTESTTSNVSDPGLTAPEPFVKSEPCFKGPLPNKADTPTVSETNPSVVHSVIVSSATAHQSENIQVQSSQSQSVPQRAVSPLIISTSTAAGGSSQIQTEAKLSYSNIMYQNTSKDSSGPLTAAPAKKPRRGRAPKVSAPVAPDSPPSSPDSAGVGAEQAPKRRKKASKSAAVHTLNSEEQHQLTAAVNRAEGFLAAHLNQHSSATENVMRREFSSMNPMARDNASKTEPIILPPIGTTASLSIGTKDLNSHKENSSSSVGKENGLFLRNGLVAPHMLGNQLNPNSSVAQKMNDTLAAELEAHSVTNQASPVVRPNLVGVPFPSRVVSPSLKINVPSSSGITPFPQSLEQLLERQWEQGSQFLMEQAQHFDVASLLSCLHNLRQENMRLEDHVNSLNRRRDHLLAVHARLSIPFSSVPSSHMAYAGTNTNLPDRSTPGTGHSAGPRASPQERERNSRGTPYLPQIENGIGLTENLAAYMGTAFSSPHSSHRSSASSSHQSDRVVPSPVIVSSRMNPVYSSSGPINVPSTMSPVQGSSSFVTEGRNLTVLRSPSSTPEMRPDTGRSTATPSQQPPYAYQIVSPPLSAPQHHPGTYAAIATAMSNVGTNQLNMNARRDIHDSRHPLNRPSSIERR